MITQNQSVKHNLRLKVDGKLFYSGSFSAPNKEESFSLAMQCMFQCIKKVPKGATVRIAIKNKKHATAERRIV